MKIALVQLGRIGDMILMTSCIKLIKEEIPHAEIYFISGSSNYFILNNNPHIKKKLIFDKNPIKLLKFLYNLKKIKFDYYVDPKDHFSNESCFLANFANSKIKIGYNAPTKKKCFDIGIPAVEENFGKHFVERLLQALAPILTSNTTNKTINSNSKSNSKKTTNYVKNIDLGYKTLPIPKLYISEQSNNSIDYYFRKNNISNKKIVVINISASNRGKMWKEENWIEFIKQILMKKNSVSNSDIHILTSDKLHVKTAENICAATNILHFPPSKFDIVTTLISRSKLLVSPDTSLIHVASAFNIPVIALTCNVPWSVSKFSPLSSKKIVLLPKEINGQIDLLSVSEVLEAYEQMNTSY